MNANSYKLLISFLNHYDCECEKSPGNKTIKVVHASLPLPSFYKYHCIEYPVENKQLITFYQLLLGCGLTNLQLHC